MRRLVICLALLVACTSRPGPSDFVLRIAVPGPLAPLDPFADSSFTTAAIDLVFTSILMTDEQGRPFSRIAQRWERLSPSRYRIQIDPNARFSDGSPVTPQDVSASLARLELKAAQNADWIEIESRSSLSLDLALPEASVFKKTSAGFIGTGPFAVVEADAWHISLRRVRPILGRIGRVEILAFPTPRDVFARLLRGEANAAFGLDDRQIELINGVPGLATTRSWGPRSFAILLNPTRLDRSTRRAVRDSLALSEIGRAAYGDACRREGDGPERAPAGHGSIEIGNPIKILTLGIDPGWERAGLAVRRAIGSRGGDLERTDALQGSMRIKSGDFDLAFILESMWPPIQLAYRWETGASGNFLGYSNKVVDEDFRRGDNFAAQRELENDAVLLLLCRQERVAVLDARIKNPRLGTLGILDSLPEWEVEP